MTNFATKKNLSSSKNKKNISFKIFDQNFDLVKKTRKGILKCCLYSRSAAAEKIFFIIFERIERERERERREREKATFIINCNSVRYTVEHGYNYITITVITNNIV